MDDFTQMTYEDQLGAIHKSLQMVQKLIESVDLEVVSSTMLELKALEEYLAQNLREYDKTNRLTER